MLSVNFLDGFSASEIISTWLNEFPCYFVRLPFANENSPLEAADYDDEALIALSLSHSFRLDINNFPENFPHLNDNKWWFCSFSYELGLRMNNIQPHNKNILQQPALSAFQPDIVLSEKNNKWKILYSVSDEIINSVLRKIQLSIDKVKVYLPTLDLHFHTMPSFNSYKIAIQKIQQHLQRGDIYELNYCVAAQGEVASIDPVNVFKKLISQTFAPFSTLAKYDQFVLISASPERFIKSNNHSISLQPMKGTAKRFKNNAAQDIQSLKGLIESEKERAENVMIVDLSRNDLAKFAGLGVEVTELFGLRSLHNLHQMVSTIIAPVPSSFSWLNLIKCLFPPGSMTGAPKISAMQIINQLEDFYRGLFSGITGFIRPDNSFDFCVVIRSVILNTQSKTLMVPAGSAITLLSSCENEFQECLLKMQSMMFALNQNEH